MSVEAAREALVALETEQAESRIDQLVKDAEHALKALELEQEISARRHTQIVEARRELQRQERLAEAAAEAQEVDESVERLRDRYLRKSKGCLWFEGTGNNDPAMAHQMQAMMFGAYARRWILADGPGLGKTRSTIGWLHLIDARKVVIVCEANICEQFAGEVMTLAPERPLTNLHPGKAITKDKRHELLDNAVSMDNGVIVVNFEIWRKDRDVLAKLMMWQADTVIVDEAHNLKTTASANFGYIKTLIAVDNVCPNCSGLIKGFYDPEKLNETPSKKVPVPCNTCGYRIGDELRVKKVYNNKLEQWLVSKSVKNVCFTTGTPILNDPADLYSLLHLCNPILFPTKASFQKTYLVLDHMSNKWTFRMGGLKNLKPLISGVYLQRSLKDIGIELPKQHVHVIPVVLDKLEYPKQYRTIRQISEAAQIILDSGETMTIMHLISLITRKRQANVWPGGIKVYDKSTDPPTLLFDVGAEVQESVKLDVIQDKIAELHAEGRRQIVFSQFKTGLAELEERLLEAGIRAVRFDGDTPEGIRTQVKHNFNRAFGEEPKWDVVLANYKTGGTGLNFTAASATHVIDEEWNPGKQDQSYARTDRIGQTEENDVFVYRIPGTIDTWMSNIKSRKAKMIAGFTDTIVETPTEMISNLKEAMMNGSIL